MKTPVRQVVIATTAQTQIGKHNSGESAFGNSTEIKRDGNGRPYISGQIIRHALMEVVRELNRLDFESGEVQELLRISNAHNPNPDVDKDLYSDLIGYFIAEKAENAGTQAKRLQDHPSYLQKRTSPMRVMTAIELYNNGTFHDLLTRYNEEDSTQNNIAKLEMVSSTEFAFAFQMLCEEFGSLPLPLKDGDGLYNGRVTLLTPEERMRRVKMSMESVRLLNGFANQSRSLSSYQPNRVIIGLGVKGNNKLIRYWQTQDQTTRNNIIEEFIDDGGMVFIGDDSTEKGVFKAFKEAYAYLDEAGLSESFWNDTPMSVDEFLGMSKKHKEEFLKKVQA